MKGTPIEVGCPTCLADDWNQCKDLPEDVVHVERRVFWLQDNIERLESLISSLEVWKGRVQGRNDY